jgi:hypothetical protein
MEVQRPSRTVIKLSMTFSYQQVHARWRKRGTRIDGDGATIARKGKLIWKVCTSALEKLELERRRSEACVGHSATVAVTCEREEQMHLLCVLAQSGLRSGASLLIALYGIKVLRKSGSVEESLWSEHSGSELTIDPGALDKRHRLGCPHATAPLERGSEVAFSEANRETTTKDPTIPPAVAQRDAFLGVETPGPKLDSTHLPADSHAVLFVKPGSARLPSTSRWER